MPLMYCFPPANGPPSVTFPQILSIGSKSKRGGTTAPLMHRQPGDEITACSEGLCVRYRVLGNHHYRPGSRGLSPCLVVTIRDVSRHCQCPWGINSPSAENPGEMQPRWEPCPGGQGQTRKDLSIPWECGLTLPPVHRGWAKTSAGRCGALPSHLARDAPYPAGCPPRGS